MVVSHPRLLPHWGTVVPSWWPNNIWQQTDVNRWCLGACHFVSRRGRRGEDGTFWLSHNNIACQGLDCTNCPVGYSFLTVLVFVTITMVCHKTRTIRKRWAINNCKHSIEYCTVMWSERAWEQWCDWGRHISSDRNLENPKQISRSNAFCIQVILCFPRLDWFP